MSSPHISDAVRAAVAKAAKHRCGYCLTQTRVIGLLMNIDHFVPVSDGGSSDESNLWLACSWCNGHKAAKLSAPDFQSGQEVPIFNPRLQVWKDHFAWTSDGLHIVGLTAIGRATVEALQMNNIHVVKSRLLWVAAGWHPPED